jgi:hypothetical protein
VEHFAKRSNMNRENFQKVLDQIQSHPETWKQSSWHCGTTHCFAGWAQILAGKSPDEDTVRRDARMFLELSLADADYLFAPHRPLSDFREYLATNRAGYNSAGYDSDGYDSDGYNSDGYNRAGYDSDGYNSDGYNSAGYNRAWYNSDGYNRAGYNSDGYNRAGYNSDGYNRAGYNSARYNSAGYDSDGLDVNLKPENS